MQLNAEMIIRAKEGSLYDLYCLQEHYDNYIRTLSIVYAIEPNGHMMRHMNIEIREQLKECVIEATLKFDIDKRVKGTQKHIIAQEGQNGDCR